MLINYKSRNLEITDALKEYTAKRLSKFDKLIGAEEATVMMRSIKDRQRLEITIPYHGITALLSAVKRKAMICLPALTM